MSCNVTWRELRPLEESLFRCDYPGCGEQANTIHLVPWCDRNCEQALFACPRHDPGGYWFPLAEWIDSEQRDGWVRHLGEKLDPRCDRPGGLGLLLARTEALTYPVVRVDEPAANPPTRPKSEPRTSNAELAAGEVTRYGEVALNGIVETVLGAPKGSRNDTLNKAAFRCGQLVAVGQIAENVARGKLIAAAAANGLGNLEAKSTVASGLAAGLRHPARIEERR